MNTNSKTFITFCIIIIIITCSSNLQSVRANAELRALMEMKAALDPNNKFLTSWTSGGDPCGGSFEGVACNQHRKVANISLQGKGLTGRLSPAVAGLKCLSGLYLHYNSLAGEIPVEITNLTELSDLYLNVNYFSGIIPSRIGNMANLQVLQLCCNQLTGKIPAEMGLLKRLNVIALQHNQLTGEIPMTLGNLGLLRRLDLSYNSLFGSIPMKLAIPRLEALDLQNNTLSGFVPLGLKRLKEKFQYKNNPGLCGVGFPTLRPCTAYDSSNIIQPFGETNMTAPINIPQSANIGLRPCNGTSCTHSSEFPKVVVLVSVTSASLALLVAGFLTFFFYRRKKQKISSALDTFDSRLSTDQAIEYYKKTTSPLVSLEYSNGWNQLEDAQNENGTSMDLFSNFRFNLEEIESATQHLSGLNLLGRSKFSSVYKGTLRDGSVVAIRRINETSCKSDESQFISGLKLLTALRHENLVQFRGFCCSKGRGECFLVYDFALKGSLSKYLDVEDGSCSNWVLDWSTRFSILYGIAKGIEYLHRDEEGKPAMVHRNLSVEKILIDEKGKPLISDSGLLKILADDIIFSNLKVSASLGYMAPEYITRGSYTEKSDIYVFGVIILQVLSGKKMLTNLMRNGAEFFRFGDFVDENLKGKFSEYEAEKLAKIALACTSENPENRPTMETVVQEMKNSIQAIKNL